MAQMNPTALVVTGGLVGICITALLTHNDLIAVGALSALAGWLGGNHNGSKATTQT